MNILKLVNEEIKTDEIINMVKTPTCGAISIFVGTTRDNFDGLQVKSLVYDAYEEMALKEMEKICSNARKKWPSIVNIAIYHRLGEVVVSEASVLIVISSPHRRESLEAVSYTIDSLKSSVPIWKKEEYYDSPGVWKANQECRWSHPSQEEA